MLLTLSPAPVSLLIQQEAALDVPGAGTGVTHSTGLPGGQTVASLRPSCGGGACLKIKYDKDSPCFFYPGL